MLSPVHTLPMSQRSPVALQTLAESMVVSQQIRDAHYLATHAAERAGDGSVRVVGEETSRATFLVLHGGKIMFEGTAAELFASTDPYLRRFLYRTLPPW